MKHILTDETVVNIASRKIAKRMADHDRCRELCPGATSIADEIARLKGEIAGLEIYRSSHASVVRALNDCFKASQQSAGTELRDEIQRIVHAEAIAIVDRKIEP